MSGWRRVGGGDPDRTILAVDFDSTVRAEARFPQFAALLPAGALWLTDQPEAAEKELLPVEAYLEFWADRPQGRVDAIVGFCVGAVFAPALAEAIARDQGEPPAQILIDPEPMVTASLVKDFRTAVGAMPILTPEERAAATAQVQAVCAAAGDDVGAATPGVITVYEASAGTAFDRLDLDPETREDLLGMFRSYLSYLHAAWQLRPEAGWAPALALTSSASSPGARYAAREQRFPIDTAAMLADQRVADATHRFLEER
jgi:hypothetical protein